LAQLTVLQKEVAQPQVVIQSDGRINIPKKEDGSVWTLEELREKMKWSRWPMFDELEPLFRRWWELSYKNRFHRYWTVEELMEMKDIQQFLGLESS
jgi:hypothetical protein